MTDPIITVENLSKRYKLGTIGATSLRESVERAWYRVRGRDWRHHMGEVGAQRSEAGGRKSASNTSNVSPLTSHDSPNELWALKDVSFEVKRGEVLGVIGRNGAGKSTLLKILTRITDPTTGRAIMRGRVASLLEVGTGFHPELTGRENVYLNGAMLGMKRAEITQRFDEIVAFAEVEKFIDTPVKRYSSGMYVRLAFAVAAHLESEILLIDEVLAVGDAAFQKRCLGRMGEVARCGRTVLFVSHNMTAVENLCHRGLLIENGELRMSGSPESIITYYLDSMKVSNAQNSPLIPRLVNRSGDGRISFTTATLLDRDGHESNIAISGKDLTIRLGYKCNDQQLVNNLIVSIGIHNANGFLMLYLSNELTGTDIVNIDKQGYLVCEVPRLPLLAGEYTYNFLFSTLGSICDYVQDRFTFTVVSGDFFGTGKLPPSYYKGVLVDQKWRFFSNE